MKHVISDYTHDLFRVLSYVSAWTNLDYLLAEYLPCTASMKWNRQHLRTQGAMHHNLQRL